MWKNNWEEKKQTKPQNKTNKNGKQANNNEKAKQIKFSFQHLCHLEAYMTLTSSNRVQLLKSPLKVMWS